MTEQNPLKPLFADIADAIREKDGSAEPIPAETFPERIRAISAISEQYIKLRYLDTNAPISFNDWVINSNQSFDVVTEVYEKTSSLQILSSFTNTSRFYLNIDASGNILHSTIEGISHDFNIASLLGKQFRVLTLYGNNHTSSSYHGRTTMWFQIRENEFDSWQDLPEIIGQESTSPNTADVTSKYVAGGSDGFRLLYLRMMDSDSLRAYYYPYKRVSDGAIGLYIEERNEFYPIAGAIAGPAV